MGRELCDLQIPTVEVEDLEGEEELERCRASVLSIASANTASIPSKNLQSRL